MRKAKTAPQENSDSECSLDAKSQPDTLPVQQCYPNPTVKRLKKEIEQVSKTAKEDMQRQKDELKREFDQKMLHSMTP